MLLDVTSNIKQFTKKLSRFQKKQVAFATAKALTLTAKDAQKGQIANAKRVFENKKVWYRKNQPTGFKITPATKTRQVSSVHSKAPFLPLQEHGGTKRPKSSSNLAIPTDNVPKKFRKTGGVGKALATGKAFFGAIGGKRALFRRVGGKRQRRSQLMFVFQPKAKITPRLGFEALAKRVGKKQFKRHFERSLNNAIRTAL